MQEWTATETLLYFNSHPHIEDDSKYVQIQAVQSLEFATYSQFSSN